MCDICSKGTSHKFLGGLRELGRKLVKNGWLSVAVKHVAYLLACSRYDEYTRKHIVKQLKYNPYSRSFSLQLYLLKNRAC